MTPHRRAWPAGVIGEHGVVQILADGTRLHADIYRPAHAGALPALFMRLPYDRAIAELDTGVAHPSWFAAQGYAVVVQDVRGTGSSTGSFEPFRNEASDGVESIRWVASLDGVDGRVMTYGSSYMGITQLLVAAERPTALWGIAPAFAASGVYDGWITESGVANLAFIATWTLNMAKAQARRHGDEAAFRMFGDVVAGMTEQPQRLPSMFEDLVDSPAMRRLVPWVAAWWRHRQQPAWWRHWNVEQRYRDIEVPGWHAAGVHDLFAHGTLENFVGLRSMAAAELTNHSQRLILGPWSHDPGAAPVAGASVNRLDELWLEWVADVLDRRVPAQSPVTVWLGSHGWCGFETWPPAMPSTQTWFLRSRGRAQSLHGDGWLDIRPGESDEPADVLLDAPTSPVPTVGGRSLGHLSWMGPQDQRLREGLRTVLVYTTAPAMSAFCIVGDVVIDVAVSAQRAPASLVARLSVVDADEASTNLQDGISIVTSARVVENVQLSLGPVAHHVERGQRLRLTLAATDHPRWERVGPSHPVWISVLHSLDHQSSIRVPLEWH